MKSLFQKYLFLFFLSLGSFSVFGQTTIISETLRTGSLPTNWSSTSIDFRTSAGGYALFQNFNSELVTVEFNASAYTSIDVKLDVAKFGSGSNGPVTVEYSLDGGVNWVNQGNSATPTGSSYLTSTINIPSVSATMLVKITRASSTSQKRVRDFEILGIGSAGPTTPSLTTTTASSITFNSASSGGNITADGGSSVTARGIVYSTSANPTLSDIIVTSGSGTGSYTSNLTGLSAATTYYVKAYATNAQGTAYGNEVSFTTSCISFSLPFLETFETGSSSLSCWSTVSTGTGWEITTGRSKSGTQSFYHNDNSGYEESELISPVIDLTGAVNPELSFFENGNYITSIVLHEVAISTDGGTSWSAPVYDQNPGEDTWGEVTIDISSYAGSSVNVRFLYHGNYDDEWYIDDFEIKDKVCTAPSTQASAITFTTTTDTETIFSWNNGNGSGRVVKMNSINSFTAPVDGSVPAANNTWQNSGEQVVYNGIGNSVSIDNLDPTSTYWFRVYEYNCSGANTLYNSSTASDNPKSVTTTAVPITAGACELYISEVSHAVSYQSGFLEIYNPTSNYISLSGAKLIMLPDNAVLDFGIDGSGDMAIPANGFLVVSRSHNKADFENAWGITLPANTAFYQGNNTTFFGNNREWQLKQGGTVDVNNGTLIDETGKRVADGDRVFQNPIGTWVSGLRDEATPGELESTQVANLLAPSGAPSNQATVLNFSNITTNSIDGSFTAASGSPEYIVLIKTTAFTAADSPVNGNTYTAGDNIGGAEVLQVSSSTSFSANLLSSSTTYYFVIFSFEAGCSVNYNTTNPLEGNATTNSCTVPSTQANSLLFSNTTYNTTDLSWINGNGANRVVLLNSTNSFTAPVNGTNPTANTAWQNSGQQVIYNGNGSNVSVTGLDPTTTYWFRVYEYSCLGASSIFNSSTAANNPNNVTTPVMPPGVNLVCSNFEDGDISDWAVSSNWAATTDNAINGSYSVQHKKPGCSGASKDYLSYDLSTQNIDLNANSTTWQFNLENGNWDPSTGNYFGVFLTANGSNLGYSNNINGYFVGVNQNETPGNDYLTLWKIENGFNNGTWTAIVTSSFDWNNADRVGIKVTRTVTGEWELLYDADGDFDNLVSAGTQTDSTYNFSSGDNYFGLVFEYSSSRACQLWWDDISVYQGTSACPVTSSGPYHWLPTSGTHDFNDATKWSPQRTSIQNDDILIFDNGGASEATNVPSQTVGQVQVSGTSIIFSPSTGAGLRTFTIAGVIGDEDFKVDATSTFTVNSPEDFDIVIGSGASAAVYGNLNFLSNGNTAYHGFKIEDAGAAIFKNGAIFTQGPKSSGSIFGINGANNTAVFESGAQFVSRSGGNPFGKAQPDSKVDFQTGSLYKHQHGLLPSVVGRIYADFELDNNSTFKIVSGSTAGDEFTCDNLILSQGSLDFILAINNVPLNVNVKGDIYLANGSNLYFRPDEASATSSIRISGATAQTVSGGGNLAIGGFGKLEIQNDLTIHSEMRVYGVLELRSGTVNSNNNLTIASGIGYTGSLTDVSTGVVNDFTAGFTGMLNGDVKVERYVVNPNNGFHFIGSPVANAALSDWGAEFSIAATYGGTNNAQVIPTVDCSPTTLDPSSPYGGLFDYRENQVTDCRFAGWHVRNAGYVQNAEGFAGVIPNGTTIDLNGEANTGNITSYNLTRTATNTTTHQGFNMLANPYPSPLEWTDVAAVNTDIDGVAYLFQTSGSYNGTFQSINNITGGTIASSQAFQVEALSNNVSVSFSQAMRRVEGNNSFLRQAAPYDSRLILELEGNSFADRTIIAYADDFTAGYDRSYDAKKMKSNNGQPTIYTFSNPAIEKQSINAIANADKYNVLPVGFLAGANGTYTITAKDLTTFQDLELVFIEDLKTGTIQNLNANSVYSFQADINDAAHRFNLHMMPAPHLASVAVNCGGDLGQIQISFANFDINGQSVNWDKAVVKDVNGQAVATNNNPSSNWTIPNLEAGNYELLLDMGAYSVSKTISVGAMDAVQVDFSMDKTLAEIGEAVNFNNSSIGANYNEWDMGDGNILYNTVSPTHAYILAGTYTVKLLAASGECSETLSKEVEIREKIVNGINSIGVNAYNIFSYSDYIVVEMEGINADDISVFNALGQRMTTNLISSNSSRVELNLPMAVTGIYFVQIIENKKSLTKQLLIKKDN